MVERGGLENRYPDFRDRRFESSSLRLMPNSGDTILNYVKKRGESHFLLFDSQVGFGSALRNRDSKFDNGN